MSFSLIKSTRVHFVTPKRYKNSKYVVINIYVMHRYFWLKFDLNNDHKKKYKYYTNIYLRK